MNILFVTANRIGDAVLSTGVLRHLIARYPTARITVACGPAAAPIFEPAPNVVRVIAMPKQSWSRHWFGLWRQAVTTRWDVLVDLRGSGLAWLLPARQRFVLRPARAPVHRVRHNAELLGLSEPPAPTLWTTAEHEARAAALIPNGAAVLGVGPTANWGGKQWPAARFAELVERLTAADGILPDARVAVFGADGERAMAAPLLARLPDAQKIDLVGSVDLLDAYACLKRCALYIGNDSALMHMAAASGTATLGLFGPSREELYAPWGPNAAAVRGAQGFDEIVGAPDYDHRQQVSRMQGLAVEQVLAAATALWRGRGQAP